MSDERVRIQIGFDGGQTAGGQVTLAEADRLQRHLEAGGDGVVSLETDDGTLLVAMTKVAYVRRAARDSHVGFGGR